MTGLLQTHDRNSAPMLHGIDKIRKETKQPVDHIPGELPVIIATSTFIPAAPALGERASLGAFGGGICRSCGRE